MRVAQPLFHFFESQVGRASKTGNCIVAIVFLLLNIGMQIIFFYSLSSIKDGDTMVEMWWCLAKVVFLYELIIWDTVIQPLALALIAKFS